MNQNIISKLPLSELKRVKRLMEAGIEITEAGIEITEAGIEITEAGVKSSITLEEVNAELNCRKKKTIEINDKKIDELFCEAAKKFGSTLKNLKD